MSVEQLEQALVFWEDACYMARASLMLQAMRHDRPFVPTGPLKYLAFRDVLLKGTGWSEEYTYRGDAPHLKPLSTIPLLLYGWVRSSKRVFRIQADMTDELLRGDHPAPPCNWAEFPWPFRAFAISFGRPVVLHWQGDRAEYDTLLVDSVIVDGKVIMILQWLPVVLGQYSMPDAEEFMNDIMKTGETVLKIRAQALAAIPRQLRRKLKKGKLKLPPLAAQARAAGELLTDLMIGEAAEITAGMTPLANLMKHGESCLAGGLSEQVNGDDDHVRLLHAICHLIAHGKTTVNERVLPTADADDDGIAAQATIFEVGSHSKFTMGVEQKDVPQEPSGRTVRPHARRGFYRRVRGSSPEAPKTEWVNSTWVHKDRAEDRGAVSASETVVTAADKD